MVRRLSRTTRSPTPGLDWQTRDDVVSAISALRREPLPAIDLSPPPGWPHARSVVDAFQVAYGAHPVVIAARAWELDELRTDRTFRVFSALVNLNVHAARRWQAQQAEPAPF